MANKMNDKLTTQGLVVSAIRDRQMQDGLQYVLRFTTSP